MAHLNFCHVFTGVNDAPSLAAANVRMHEDDDYVHLIMICSYTLYHFLQIGIAMGNGAALAMETADVTLLDSNLEKLLYCIETGKMVTRKIKQNVLFSTVVKLVVLGFAIAGMTHLWVAIASDVGSMILVTLNAMTILPKHEKDSVSGTLRDIEDGCIAPVVPVAETDKATTVCS